MRAQAARVLAVDAAFDYVALSLEWEGGRIARSRSAGSSHSERLLPAVDEMLAEAGLVPQDLDLLCCMQGPGSFTGLRIAMAACKGISFGAGAPWTAIPSLDALAWGRGYFPGLVVPLIDAKRGAFYAALYRGGMREGEWLDIDREALFGRLVGEPRVLLTGPGADLAADWPARRDGILVDPLAAEPRCAALASLGREAFAAGRIAGDEEAPIYLRRSDAEEAREAAGMAAGPGAIGGIHGTR